MFDTKYSKTEAIGICKEIHYSKKSLISILMQPLSLFNIMILFITTIKYTQRLHSIEYVYVMFRANGYICNKGRHKILYHADY